MQKIFRRTFHICAAVYKQKFSPFGGKNRRKRRPPYPLDSFHDERGTDKKGPGTARRHQRVAIIFTEKFQSNRQRGIPLLPHDGFWVVLHLNDLGGVGNLDTRRQIIKTHVTDARQNGIAAAHKTDLHPEFLNGRNRPSYNLGRCVVSPHSIDNYSHFNLPTRQTVS
ncbi:hypothetical protein SDC9_183930 [bioreactor metagenome]|uniref:Uncharacterized protein n=1 Tax=bioreactor metagenome TaxID=1076179 RepID=A0A645HBK3_9ZZZZ